MSDTSITSPAHILLNNPGVMQAKKLVDDLKAKGFDVFYSPTSLMIIAERKTDTTPPNGVMEELWPLHHEIGLLFALQAISSHFKSMNLANKAILAIQQGTSD